MAKVEKVPSQYDAQITLTHEEAISLTKVIGRVSESVGLKSLWVQLNEAGYTYDYNDLYGTIRTRRGGEG